MSRKFKQSNLEEQENIIDFDMSINNNKLASREKN